MNLIAKLRANAVSPDAAHPNEKIVEITPDVAQELLKRFPDGSTPINETKTFWMIMLLLVRGWETKPETSLKGDYHEDIMLDGRHILTAFVESGIDKLNIWFKFF